MAVKNWCFTLNNPTDAEKDKLDEHVNMKYMVYGREVAPETGTPHLQGFIVFVRNQRLSACRKLLDRAHWEAARGSAAEAAAYCKKDGSFVEWGDCPVPKEVQEKERWAKARRAAIAGNMEEIPDDIFIRCYSQVKRIAAEHQHKPEPLEVMDFHWYWGESGTGKSHTARTENPDHYLKQLNKWWDGYKGEACVIIEEWSPKTTDYLASYLKQWADKWPFNAEVKGSTMCIRPPKLIVTSNYTIEQCFPEPADHLPLLRRFESHQFFPLSP